MQVELSRYLDLVGKGQVPESVLQRIRTVESNLRVREGKLAAWTVPNVVNFEEESVRRRAAQNLEQFRELLTSRRLATSAGIARMAHGRASR